MSIIAVIVSPASLVSILYEATGEIAADVSDIRTAIIAAISDRIVKDFESHNIDTENLGGTLIVSDDSSGQSRGSRVINHDVTRNNYKWAGGQATILHIVTLTSVAS